MRPGRPAGAARWFWFTFFFSAFALFAGPRIAVAQVTDGTWTQANSSLNWTDATSWANGNVAFGTDKTADFSTFNLTNYGSETIHLSSAWVIGNLIFGDPSQTYNWTVDGDGFFNGNTLTLAVSSGSPTINVLNDTTTLTTTLGGTQGFTKTGPGTLVLDTDGPGGSFSFGSMTGAINAYGGSLIIGYGLYNGLLSGLNVGNGTGAPGSAAVTILGSGTYQFSSGGAPVTIKSDGVLNMSANNEFEVHGNLTMTGGTIQGPANSIYFIGYSVTTLASNYPATVMGPMSVFLDSFVKGTTQSTFNVARGTTASGIDLDLQGPVTDYYSGLEGPLGFAQPGGINKTGTGALRLGGSNSFSGGVTLGSGAVIVGNNNALGTGTLTAGFGNLQADSNGPYTVSNAISVAAVTLTVEGSNNLTLSGTISGGGGINVFGPLTLTLSGTNAFTGQISIGQGTLVMNTSLSSNVSNSGTFVYNAGAFSGQLTNFGTAIFNTTFVAGNGLVNNGLVSVAAGQNLVVNGAGLNNQGTIAMTGGTLFTSGSGTNTNGGTISLSPTTQLSLGSGVLNNNGLLNLNGGLISGGLAELFNNPGAMISGTGTIQSLLFNSGTLQVGSGGLTIGHAFTLTNNGAIQLTATTSSLSGGAISNAGTINGVGNLGNAVTNTGSGTIEAIGGILSVGGTLANQAGGLLTADAGAKMLVTQGLAANAGIINLTGGTFDNNGFALSNTGQISGFGIFRTGGTGLDNNGSVTFSGGLTTVNGNVTNENGKTVTIAYNPAIFTGLVTNNGTGTFKTTSTTATFAGGFSGTFTNAISGNFIKAGDGTLEIDGAPTLGNSSALSVGDTGTLRFNVVSGTPSIGTGVTATVAAGATLELAGSVSALGSGANQTNVINNSTATAGVLVSGTNQQVGTITGSGNVVVNDGSDLTASSIRQGSLTIGAAAGPSKVTIRQSGLGNSPVNNTADSGSLNSLSIANNGAPLGTRTYRGTLDINNNGLVIPYTAGNSPLANIEDMVRAGYHGGAFNSPGIVSTTATQTAGLNIAVADNAQLVTPYTTFEGQAVSTNSVLVRMTYMDDLTLSGVVTQNDAIIFGSNYDNGAASNHTWSQGDLNHDGKIDQNDAILFGSFYNPALPQLDGSSGGLSSLSSAASLGGNLNAVPEPATWLLAICGLLGLWRTGRRKP